LTTRPPTSASRKRMLNKLRGEHLSRTLTFDQSRAIHMAPALFDFVKGAAAAGCPMAMNLVDQWNNCIRVLPR
jgi:hypothetical protein